MKPMSDNSGGAPSPISRAVDFLIITALEEERNAVLGKLPGYRKLDRDGTGAHTYYEAKVATRRSDGAVYSIIVTSLSGMGPIKGAIKAGAVTKSWRPQHVLLVGIAGGILGEVAVGDVMVASQVPDYTLGKVRDEGSRSVRWVDHLPDADLFDAANNFAEGWKDLVGQERPEPGEPRRHVGVVASGGDVVASKEVIKTYIAHFPKLIGVEMEGSGVAAGLHDDIQRPRFLMIRGVSDLANGEDNATMKQRWRAYACDVAAAYAIGLLREGVGPSEQQKATDRRRREAERDKMLRENERELVELGKNLEQLTPDFLQRFKARLQRMRRLGSALVVLSTIGVLLTFAWVQDPFLKFIATLVVGIAAFLGVAWLVDSRLEQRRLAKIQKEHDDLSQRKAEADRKQESTSGGSDATS